MERLKVELGERSYPIEIAAGLLQRPEVLTQTIKGKRVMIVTNTVVAPCCKPKSRPAKCWSVWPSSATPCMKKSQTLSSRRMIKVQK